MGGLSWWHWLVIAAVFIMLFGAKKLPDAARGVGQSLRILKSEVGALNQNDQNDQINQRGQREGDPAVTGAAPSLETARVSVPSAIETRRATG
jgi:sec-independent protein translocase protein TatA